MFYIIISVDFDITDKRWTTMDRLIGTLATRLSLQYDGYQRGGMTEQDPHMWYVITKSKQKAANFIFHALSNRDIINIEISR
jgi:hypothetical protein